MKILFDQLHIDIYITDELTTSERKTLISALDGKDLKDLELIIGATIMVTPNLARKIRIELTK